MTFFQVFWTAYVPFAIVILLIVGERLKPSFLRATRTVRSLAPLAGRGLG
jgi:hypothetical protein